MRRSRRLRRLRGGLPDRRRLLRPPARGRGHAQAAHLLQAYREAGGGTAVVLLHDGDHGEALIDALARFGDGLPANVLPLRVNEVTQVGLETVAAAFAYGAAAVRFLARAKPKHDLRAFTAQSPSRRRSSPPSGTARKA